MHLSPLTSFFFYCSAHHPHLHSFPTRRSSDLASIAQQRKIQLHSVQATIEAGHDLHGILGADAEVRNGFSECSRSEEHTSELQSRGHLVCRLLLEKKKKKIKTYRQYM